MIIINKLFFYFVWIFLLVNIPVLQALRRWDVCRPCVTRKLWECGTVCRTRWQPSSPSLCPLTGGGKSYPTSIWVRTRTRLWREWPYVKLPVWWVVSAESLCRVWLLLCRFYCSGVDVLQYNDVSFEMLATAFQECLSSYTEFSQRLKIEGKGWFCILKHHWL